MLFRRPQTATFSISGTAGVNDGGRLIFGDSMVDPTPDYSIEFDNNGVTSSYADITVEMTGTDTQMWAALASAIEQTYYSTNVTFVDNSDGTATFTMTSSLGGAAYNDRLYTTIFGLGTYIAITDRGSGGTDTYVREGLQSANIVVPRITSSVTDMVFTTRFSAPGGIEVQSYGFLDAYAHEYSVHNNLNYRNLTVRGSGSGESGTIRLDDHLGNRHGLKTHLRRHSGRFGSDSVYGSVPEATYVTSPSFFKQQRNENRRPSDTSTVLSPVLVTRHDNMYINSPIPRSDFQYKWVTSSLGDNYSITSGKQRMYGYAHRSGIMSSSAVIDGDSGFVPAITFLQ
jgi:hypothetical protein